MDRDARRPAPSAVLPWRPGGQGCGEGCSATSHGPAASPTKGDPRSVAAEWALGSGGIDGLSTPSTFRARARVLLLPAKRPGPAGGRQPGEKSWTRAILVPHPWTPASDRACRGDQRLLGARSSSGIPRSSTPTNRWVPSQQREIRQWRYARGHGKTGADDGIGPYRIRVKESTAMTYGLAPPLMPKPCSARTVGLHQRTSSCQNQGRNGLLRPRTTSTSCRRVGKAFLGPAS